LFSSDNAEELTPNVGLFWYFFTELFDHFRAFFIFVLQYHVFLYVLPLCIRFRKFPIVALWGQLAIICAFKAYPAAGDIALYLGLIPLFVHLLTEVSYAIFLSIVWIYVMFLLPVMWRMWVWTGTGNANFYYALNLVIALAQSMLIVDVMSSVLKRDFLIRTKLKEAIAKKTEKRKDD
jgi:GPI-anchor transamidase subunit U